MKNIKSRQAKYKIGSVVIFKQCKINDWYNIWKMRRKDKFNDNEFVTETDYGIIDKIEKSEWASTVTNVRVKVYDENYNYKYTNWFVKTRDVKLVSKEKALILGL